MQTKGPPPISYLGAGAVSIFVEVYFEFCQLKQLYRQGWLARGVPPERCETVAEHSFGVAILALFLADAYFPRLDAGRVVRMALLHDFGEIYAGDLTPADAVAAPEKRARERQAVLQVLAKLPEGAAYLALWEEYERGRSAEARLVRQLDRLEMALQASVYRAAHLIDPAEFFASADQALTAPELRAVLRELESL